MFLAVLILSLSGSACCGDVSKFKELGPSLLRLTSAVEGVAERPEVYGFKRGESGEKCIHFGVEDDPSLLTPFEGFLVKAKCETKHAIVLICDAEGKKALFEDAGCTTYVDWPVDNTVRPSRECDFSIQLEAVCK
jgi:hypothetical protein